MRRFLQSTSGESTNQSSQWPRLRLPIISLARSAVSDSLSREADGPFGEAGGGPVRLEPPGDLDLLLPLLPVHVPPHSRPQAPDDGGVHAEPREKLLHPPRGEAARGPPRLESAVEAVVADPRAAEVEPAPPPRVVAGFPVLDADGAVPRHPPVGGLLPREGDGVPDELREVESAVSPRLFRRCGTGGWGSGSRFSFRRCHCGRTPSGTFPAPVPTGRSGGS